MPPTPPSRQPGWGPEKPRTDDCGALSTTVILGISYAVNPLSRRNGRSA